MIKIISNIQYYQKHISPNTSPHYCSVSNEFSICTFYCNCADDTALPFFYYFLHVYEVNQKLCFISLITAACYIIK